MYHYGDVQIYALSSEDGSHSFLRMSANLQIPSVFYISVQIARVRTYSSGIEGPIKNENDPTQLPIKNAPNRFRYFLRFSGFILSFSIFSASLCLSVWQTYRYFFYVPDAVAVVWDSVKDDEWLRDELGAPLKMKSSWDGYVHEEGAKINFQINGSNKSRYGQIYADLIKSMDGSKWDIVSVRFARTDPEAVAEGLAADGDPSSNEDAMFTSNDGPGTKTTVVPLGMMKTGFPIETDDVVAARQGHSVMHGTQPVACPYVPKNKKSEGAVV